MRLIRLSCTALGLLAISCGGEVPRSTPPPPPNALPLPPKAAEPTTRAETPDAPFRAKAPTPGENVPFEAPEVKRFTLKNGISVMLVERPTLPFLTMRVVVRAGAGDLGAKPASVSFLGSMLLQGTEKKNALELSDAFAAIGASYGSGFDFDSGDVFVRVLSEHVKPALDLLTEVVLQPSFPEEEIERTRSRRLTAIAEERNSPRQVAMNTLAPALYGRAHPYGHSLGGREADVKAITRADLLALYKKTFVPKLTTIVVAGDISEAALKSALEPRFGAWKGPAVGVRPVPKPDPKAVKDVPRLVMVDKPGAPQSQVYVSSVAIAHDHPDRDAIDVMNAILGGMFSSRINLNLREKHAYTYGARSVFSQRRGASPFFVGAAIVREKTGPAISEIFHEMDAMRGNLVTPEELALAKDSLLQAMPARFETVSDLTSALADIAIYGLPADELKSRPERIKRVTAEDVKRVAGTWLKPDAMKVIVVGDRAVIENDLVGLKLGFPEMRDAFGDPIANVKMNEKR